MARGGRRSANGTRTVNGRRTTPQRVAGTQATGGARGYPTSAQGNRTSFAQSGGRNTKFGGEAPSSGGAWVRPGAGRNADGTAVHGRGSYGNGTRYNLRGPGGDAALVRGTLSGAHVGNTIPQGNAVRGKTNAGKTIRPTQRRPAGPGSRST